MMRGSYNIIKRSFALHCGSRFEILKQRGLIASGIIGVEVELQSPELAFGDVP